MKAVCIQPAFMGGSLREYGDEVDISNIKYDRRYCFEYEGVSLEEMDLAEKLFMPEEQQSTVVVKKNKEIKLLEGRLKELGKGKSKAEVELAELKAKIDSGDLVAPVDVARKEVKKKIAVEKKAKPAEPEIVITPEDDSIF